MRVLRAEGFDGSYPTLTRYLREVLGPSRGGTPAVTVPIETGPGEEFQFDWSDYNIWARRWGWDHELFCFGAVLCWCRRKHWWFTDAIGQPETLEGLAGFFDAIDGVPAVGRTDRMGQLGSSRGETVRVVPGGVGVRPPLRLRSQGLRPQGRRPEGQGRAAVPGPQARVPG